MEAELGEHRQMIEAIDAELPSLVKRIVSEPPTQPVPTPTKNWDFGRAEWLVK